MSSGFGMGISELLVILLLPIALPLVAVGLLFFGARAADAPMPRTVEVPAAVAAPPSSVVVPVPEMAPPTPH